MNEKQQHWDQVYSNKPPTEVSWYEPMPEISLELIKSCNLDKNAAIIDIGGGDSFLAEFLVAQGYQNVSVLDISSNAIERAKTRMCEKADLINWTVADVSEFRTPKKFDLWHDRATFHFLTDEKKRSSYLENMNSAIRPGGFLIMATFSDKGPAMCSGLPVKGYTVSEMTTILKEDFELISGKNVDHQTPTGEQQNFTFCCLQKKENDNCPDCA